MKTEQLALFSFHMLDSNLFLWANILYTQYKNSLSYQKENTQFFDMSVERDHELFSSSAIIKKVGKTIFLKELSVCFYTFCSSGWMLI